MKVKIDTKEKFHVITPEEPVLSANMTEELKQKFFKNGNYLPFVAETNGGDVSINF